MIQLSLRPLCSLDCASFVTKPRVLNQSRNRGSKSNDAWNLVLYFVLQFSKVCQVDLLTYWVPAYEVSSFLPCRSGHLHPIVEALVRLTTVVLVTKFLNRYTTNRLMFTRATSIWSFVTMTKPTGNTCDLYRIWCSRWDPMCVGDPGIICKDSDGTAKKNMDHWKFSVSKPRRITRMYL